MGKNRSYGQIVRKQDYDLRVAPGVRIRRALREFHFHNQNGLCAYCECEMRMKPPKKHPKDNDATLEHIALKRKGGKDTKLNTINICHDCNQARMDKPLTKQHIAAILRLKGVMGIFPIFNSFWVVFRNKKVARDK